jgi:hypothetical protein
MTAPGSLQNCGARFRSTAAANRNVKLGEQEAEHAADRGGGAARLIERRPEFDGFDLPPVQQSLQPSAEEHRRNKKNEPAISIARGGPGAGVVAPDHAGGGAADRRFARTREEQSARASLEHRKANSLYGRRPYPELRRAAVGDPLSKQPAKVSQWSTLNGNFPAPGGSVARRAVPIPANWTHAQRAQPSWSVANSPKSLD